jgi:hypothetical protein
VAIEEQRGIAEVQAAVIMARRFPRDHVAAVNRILASCQRPTLAEAATYTYARGGADVTGPSIRLAEAIAQQWGNLQFGIRELSQANGESTVEAFAWDLETNVRQSKVFQVKHERHTRSGSKRLTDPRDIYETVANNGARRLRACILGILPGDVVDAAVAECDRTLRTRVEVTPERVAAMVETFATTYGVTRAMIEKRLQRNLESITPAQFLSLGKIANSLRDGMSTTSDWFDVPPPTATPAPSAPPLRFTKAQMAQARAEIMAKVTTAEVIAERFPNLHPEQLAELKALAPDSEAANA